MEILQGQGIGDIRVVSGYRHERVEHPKVKKIENTDYREANSLHSLMLGLESCTQRTLVTFGDILFDRQLVRRLLESPADRNFVLVIDQVHAQSAGPGKKADPDLVKARHDPITGSRPLNLERENLILKIGKNVERNGPLYEFSGLFLLSRRGVEIFKEEYQRAEREFTGRPFFGAESLKKAGVTDFFQYLIDRDYPLYTLEVFGGWHEIHSFSDYQSICEKLAAVNPPPQEVP